MPPSTHDKISNTFFLLLLLPCVSLSRFTTHHTRWHPLCSVCVCIQGAAKLTKDDIEKVFSLYDRASISTIKRFFWCRLLHDDATSLGGANHCQWHVQLPIPYINWWLIVTLRLLCILFQDNNGTIENEELRGFLKDLLELVKKVHTSTCDGINLISNTRQRK